MAEEYKSLLEDEEKLNGIAKVAFDNVNTDKSGKIDKSQLEALMNQVFTDLSNESPTKKEIDEVFDYLDSNKKGTISFDDFKILIKDVIKNMIEEIS